MEKYVKLKDVNNMLVKMHEEPRYQHEGEDYHSGVAQVAVMLIDVPAVEIEEPKIGKWISASTKPGVQIGMKCSLCGARIKYSEFYNGNHNYCHKCGAKMVKENN